MVIPDTSVWIEYFKGNEPYFDKLHQLIEQGSVYTVEVIFAELLQVALNTSVVSYMFCRIPPHP